MSIWKKVSDIYKKVDAKVGGYLPGGVSRSSSKQTTQTTQKLPPKTQEPIRSIDYGGSGGGRIGGVTIQGSNVWSSSGSGGTSSASGQSVKILSSDFDEQTTKKLVAQEGFAVRQEQSQDNKLQSQIQSTQNQPLGTTQAKANLPWYKRGYYSVADTISGITGGVWLEHFGRPTSKTASEIKQEFKESTARGFRRSNIFGIGFFGGYGIGLKGSGKFGVGYSSAITGVQTEWSGSAKEFRESGLQTQAEQEKNIKDIESAVAKITESQDKLTESGYYKQAETFESDINKLEVDILRFNTKYEGKQLSQSTYEKALTEQGALESRRTELEKAQTKLQTQYEDYEKGLISEIETLRKAGVSTKLTDGQIMFSSKALETKISPVGMKLQASFKKDGKVTWKNVAYGGGAVAHTTAEFVGIGFLTGGTGVVAKVGTGVAKLPKAVQTALKIGAGGLVVAGVGVKTYKGYKLGQVEDVGKIGAVVGGLSATGQIAGFTYGAYKGTQFYYKGIEQRILAGKYTKSVQEVKEGAILKGTKQGALTRQLGSYETKIAGTKYKIQTYAKFTGKYSGKAGQSDVQIISKFIGKAPKGYPKTFVTKGATLETDKLIKARLFTKGKGKVWYQQDVLLQRAIISQKSVKPTSPFYKGYERLEELKFITGAKVVGKPVKVGTAIPKNIWTSGEKYLFRVSKGTEKVAGIGEFAEAKSDSLFGTKQFLLYEPSKKVGTINIQKFDSLAESRGASAQLLKKILSDKLIVLNEKTKDVSLISLGKKGSLGLGAPKQITKTPSVNVKTPNLEPVKLNIDTKALLRIQLSKIVPGIIQKESLIISQTSVPVSAGVIGLKNILDVKIKNVQVPSVKNLTALKSQLQTKVAQIQVQNIIATPKIAMPKIQASVLNPPISQALYTAPNVPIMPIVPVFDLPDITGFVQRQARQSVKAGRQRATYVEGFTAKVIDLKPIEINIKQAERLLKKELTGLELRRGVIVK